jgi:PKD repeat protein
MKTKSVIASICLLFALLTFMSAAAAPPNEIAFSPVQKGFVTAGQNVPQYAPGRILVKFSEASLQSSRLAIAPQKGTEVPSATTGIATVDALGRELGVTRIARPYIELANKAEASRLGVERWFMLDLADGADVMDAVARYAADPSVESAQPDWLAFPAVVPTDPMYPASWGHNNTAQLPGLDWGGTYDHTLSTTVGTPGFDANAEAAWSAAQGFGSSSVVIAIIDTGADLDHPDLNLVTGYDFGDNDSNPDDNSSGGGHGTCCAGVAAAKANNGLGACGIAPGCKVMPLKVANSAGSMYFSAIQNALYYAADHGASIISMSLGAAISSDPATDTAIQYAYSHGCIILAATGNENKSTISYPAINTYVVGVGAASPCGDRKRSSSKSSECNPGVSTDPHSYTCDGERWWGSNYGTNTANAAGAVDILGPTILPTADIGGSGGYRSGDYEPFFNGTSCATPYVAGVCALIKSAHPTWTNVQIRTQLVNTAIDIVNVESGSGWDRYSGYGMVDAAAAVGGGGPVAPVAAFTGSPTSGTAPLTVTFTDQSSGAPTSWSWTFGDGGTSSQQNPSHTYTSTGSYTVTLTATNSAGSDGETKTNYIVVNACSAPVANFVGSPTSGGAPLTVSFTDQSTNSPTSWSWTFGDGGTSTTKNPSHVYASEGSYTVTLTATNGCGSDGETKTNYITVSSAPTWTVITSDNFESGMGTYTDGGADMSRYSGTTYAHQGRYAADIQDNSGTASSFYHTSNKNVSSYNTLQVDFWYYAVSMETGEDFWVQYYDGSAWRTVASFVSGTNFSNGSFYHAVVTIPRSSYNFPTNAKLRFMCDASDNNDDVYIDEIVFRGTTSVVGSGAEGPIADRTPAAPGACSLAQNYPNPFNPTTTISFTLSEASRVRLEVFNASGARVALLADGEMGSGEHAVAFNAQGLGSGIYFYRLTAGAFTETKKMILLR